MYLVREVLMPQTLYQSSGWERGGHLIQPFQMQLSCLVS